MSSYNKIIIVGRVGKDPELKTTGTGKALCKFSVATQDRKDAPTQWHNCVVWEKSAEIFAQYVKKGHKVLVEGSVRYEKYEEKMFTSIGVQRFVFLEKAGGAGASAEHQDNHNDNLFPF